MLACLCAGAMVAVSGWAGWAVAGNTAARWSALAAAMLNKQNFVEGLAFAVVFLGVHIVRAKRVGSSDRRRAAHMLAAFSFGVVASLAFVAGWALAHGHFGALWFATYTFRAEAGCFCRLAPAVRPRPSGPSGLPFVSRERREPSGFNHVSAVCGTWAA